MSILSSIHQMRFVLSLSISIIQIAAAISLDLTEILHPYSQMYKVLLYYTDYN